MKKMLLLTVLAVSGLGAASWSTEQVEDDFVAAFQGDEEALARAMKVCEETLTTNPNHAEAKVWHGVGLYWQSGQAFMQGDNEKAFPLMQQGIAEMDAAVELAPDDPAVRMPRGMSMLESVRAMGDNPMVPQLVAKGVLDLEKTIEVLGPGLDPLSPEERGQILFGLGELYTRQGDAEKARPLFERTVKVAAGTNWAKQAQAKLAE